MKIFINRFKPIQRINNDLYLISAEIPITEVINIQDIKEYLGCSIAFRSNKTGTYIFCDEIEEATILEENDASV
jgi:hypothetical protein